ncbi:MAG: nucleotidyltransferase family protein [Acidobacteria bacterium]|nr:nucleotidyltransferase family protein [Acidobacteriota bacterium]MBV9623790.1 nucleotidyltransferase family protein [Acidobacteriota bacterium]
MAELSHLGGDLQKVAAMSAERFDALLKLADMHHVSVRALRVIEQLAEAARRRDVQERAKRARESERRRIWQAVEWLYAIVQALEMSGCPVAVIKSLDHWPDLGSDLDLYTSGSPRKVLGVMKEKLGAKLEPRSWGDRLAYKWNFRVPGLPELVEIHVRYLGQTGEHKLLAERVVARRVMKTVNGRSFPVPAPEERILISTLQRMYRHFYFRLCDMADVAALVRSGSVNFTELRRAAELAGIWPGAATFLMLISEYINDYGGSMILPREVADSSYSPDVRVEFRNNFLRVPMGPAAGLYGSQLLSAGRHRDVRAISRLPLLPPLAISALVAFRLTGNDKGVW